MNDVVRAKNCAKNMAQNDRTTTSLGNIPELEFRKDFRKGKKKEERTNYWRYRRIEFLENMMKI